VKYIFELSSELIVVSDLKLKRHVLKYQAPSAIKSFPVGELLDKFQQCITHKMRKAWILYSHIFLVISIQSIMILIVTLKLSVKIS
jgi:hypothetical protein